MLPSLIPQYLHTLWVSVSLGLREAMDQYLRCAQSCALTLGEAPGAAVLPCPPRAGIWWEPSDCPGEPPTHGLLK